MPKWKQSKTLLVSVGVALGCAFSVFDPAILPPESKQVVQVEDETGDDSTNKLSDRIFYEKA